MKNIKHIRANETNVNANKIVIAIYTPIYSFKQNLQKSILRHIHFQYN